MIIIQKYCLLKGEHNVFSLHCTVSEIEYFAVKPEKAVTTKLEDIGMSMLRLNGWI